MANEVRQVKVEPVLDSTLENLVNSYKLVAGAGGASIQQKQLYSCLLELQDLRFRIKGLEK